MSALIELGAGFHPEISGRENVFINGMMLGLSKTEIAARFDEIVAFAELEDFIDAPVKTYSSGMYMRLGFAVAINVDPDVLLVDEVLAVGDQAFTHKCLDKFAEFRRRGRTILLVTHSLDMVTRFCDEALWLDGGQVRAQGDPQRVIDAYLPDVAQKRERQQIRLPHVPRRWIDDRATCRSGGDGGRPTTCSPRATVEHPRRACHRGGRVEDAVSGSGSSTRTASVLRTNTLIDGLRPFDLAAKPRRDCAIDRLDLVAGTYTLDVTVHRPDNTLYDQRPSHARSP